MTLPQLEKEALADLYDVPLSDASWDVYREIEHFAPFGTGNPKPVFVFRGVTVRELRRFGKAQEHLELTVCTENGCYAKAIRFFAEREMFSAEPQTNMSITLSATLERSTFGNVPELRLRIVDIALA
jgi:single-stranded-DNA-specific exonuclease